VATRDAVTLVLAAGLMAGVAACGSGRPTTTQGDIALPREQDTVAAVVPEDATFESLLRTNQIDSATASAVAGAVSGVFNPRQLRAAQPYQVSRTLDGLFREFRYEIDASKFLRVVRRTVVGAEPEFAVDVVEYPREVEMVATVAEISKENNSLSAALDAEGENIQLALALSDIFGGEIDFNSELQRGDRFEVLFERVMRDGQFAGYGEVSGAILHHGGRAITAIRATGPDGKWAWYDENGRSMKRQFLKSPLSFNPRITSSFSLSRKHPLYGFNRAHLGVDYGAPYGSPVVAVSSGTVVSAEWAGDGGRQVRIRHSGGYETYYLHLASFAPGIGAGAHVEQGELVGRVGATGAATGPHLDFRIKRDGVFVNPVLERQRMPPGEPIPASMLPAFQAARDRMLADLARRLSANLLRSSEH
jgi:murein DD-endopeptidase MepM/ murein hydrolase activator NlpD